MIGRLLILTRSHFKTMLVPLLNIGRLKGCYFLLVDNRYRTPISNTHLPCSASQLKWNLILLSESNSWCAYCKGTTRQTIELIWMKVSSCMSEILSNGERYFLNNVIKDYIEYCQRIWCKKKQWTFKIFRHVVRI